MTCALLLLVTACLLVALAAPQSSNKNEADMKEYDRLINAIERQRYIKKSLTELQTSSKCPFKVLRFRGYTRVVCDFDYCLSNYAWCSDCTQAYMAARDISPKRCPERKQGKTAGECKANKSAKKRRQVEYEDVEAGCIYNPKQSHQSKQSAGPGSDSRFV
jgi:hypothetical protein